MIEELVEGQYYWIKWKAGHTSLLPAARGDDGMYVYVPGGFDHWYWHELRKNITAIEPVKPASWGEK